MIILVIFYSLTAFVQNIRLSYFSYRQSEFPRSTAVYYRLRPARTCRCDFADEYPIPGFQDPVVVRAEIVLQYVLQFHLQTPNQIPLLFQLHIETVRMLLTWFAFGTILV